MRVRGNAKRSTAQRSMLERRRCEVPGGTPFPLPLFDFYSFPVRVERGEGGGQVGEEGERFSALGNIPFDS